MACSYAFGRIPGLVACGPTGDNGPIIAWELARTPAEVAALFGVDPCRSTLIAAQRTALWLDGFGFIPAYTAFLSLAAWAAAGRRAWPIVTALLVAGVADEVEGVLLFANLAELPGTQPQLDALFWVVRLKFLLLALATAAIAALLAWSRRTVAFGFGIVAGFGAIRALLGFFALPEPRMMQGFTVAWVALLALALVASVAPSLVSRARAARPRAPASPSA